MTTRTTRAVVAATSTLALLGAGLAAATGAQANPSGVSLTLCPGTPVLTRALTDADAGLAVTGHTTTSLSGQDTFQGTFVGTQDDSFGNTVYLFSLSGSRITKSDGTIDAGIWAGISGSPVYDSAGDLVGSVSFGYTGEQAENLAGITPAPQIFASKSSTSPAAKVKLSAANVKRAQAAGSTATSGSMTELALPRVTVGDADFATRAAAHSRALKKKTKATTTFGTAHTADLSDEPALTAGDPIATSWSYGDLPMASEGTVTAVCGSTIYAYGHPADDVGASSQTLLRAKTLAIHADGADSYVDDTIDPTPIGRLTDDRNHGVVGVLGAAPAGTTVTTHTKVGAATISHNSVVTSSYALSTGVANQVGEEILQALDQDGAGSGHATWTIGYTVNGGATKTFTGTQAFADDGGFAEDVAFTIASGVETLQSGSTSKVAIKSVSVSTTASPDYRAYVIAGADVKEGSKWVSVKSGKTISAKRGSTLKVRLNLDSNGIDSTVPATTQEIDTSLTPSKFARTEALRFEGQGDYALFSGEGDDGEDGGDFFDGPSTATIGTLVSELAAQPQFDTTLRAAFWSNSTGEHETTSAKLSPTSDLVIGRYNLNVRLK